ncbi:fibronectin type III domain-containing protein [Spirosoma aerophilum]
MKRFPNVFLIVLLMLTSLGAYAQERYPVRVYRIGEQVFTADSAGSAVFSYPANDVQIRANGTLVQLTIGKNIRYYAPTKFLDQSGAPWGLTVGASMLAYQNTTIATSGGSGSGGTITTNAGALTQGTLAPERLPPAAVLTDAAQTLKAKTLVSPVLQSPTGITKTDVGLSNVPNINPSVIVSDSLKAVPPLSATEFGLDPSGNIVPRPLFNRMQGLPNSIGAWGVTDVPTRAQTSQMISDSAGNITFSGNGKTLTKTGPKSWNIDIPGGASDVNKLYVDDKDNQLQGLITGNTTSLTALQLQVTTLQGQLTTANQTITAQNGTITGQNSVISSLSATVGAIQTAYASGSGIYVISTPALTASNVGATTLTLSWPASTSANSYTLQQATNSGFTAGLLTLATGNITTYNVTSLTPGVLYFFRIMASGGVNTAPSGWGTTSATTALGTQLTTPTLTAGLSTTSTYTFSWSAVPNATSYTLRQSTVPGMSSPVSFVTSGTSYTVTGQNPGVNSFFDLSASANGFITSATSATVSATTSNTVAGSVTPFADWNLTANGQNAAAIINGNSVTQTTNTATATSYIVGNQKIIGLGTGTIRMSVTPGQASGDLAFGTGSNTAWSSGTGFTISVSHGANNKIFVRSGTSYLAQPIIPTAIAVQIVADGVNNKAQYTTDGTTWVDIPGGTVTQVADQRIKGTVAYDLGTASNWNLVNVQTNGLTAP